MTVSTSRPPVSGETAQIAGATSSASFCLARDHCRIHDSDQKRAMIVQWKAWSAELDGQREQPN